MIAKLKTTPNTAQQSENHTENNGRNNNKQWIDKNRTTALERKVEDAEITQNPFQQLGSHYLEIIQVHII